MHRRQAGEQGEHAADRAQVTAPDTFAAAVEKAHQHRRQGRAAENQQGRLGVVVDADQLAINSGEDKRQGRPAAPANPARGAAAQPAPADPFAQRAFGAQHPAPESAEQHDGQQHERPPEAPENKLGEQRQVVEHARLAGRQGQQRRQHQQQAIEGHHRPLHATNQPPVTTQGIAQVAEQGIQLAHGDTLGELRHTQTR